MFPAVGRQSRAEIQQRVRPLFFDFPDDEQAADCMFVVWLIFRCNR